MATLQKSYDCMGCGQQILLEKIDPLPPGQKKRWNRYELDGKTEHVCTKKQQQEQEQPEQPQPQNQQTLPKSELADLQKEIADVKSLVKAQISQIQLLRQEVAALAANKNGNGKTKR